MNLQEIEKAIADWCNENPEQRGVYFAAAEFVESDNPNRVSSSGLIGGDFYKIVPTIAQSMSKPAIEAAIKYAADVFEDTIKPQLQKEGNPFVKESKPTKHIAS